MNFVEPIRDIEVLEDIQRFLKHKEMRDYALFLLGIYTGLRVSDILKLKVKDVRNQKHIVIKEKKTKKAKRIPIHPMIKKGLKQYLEGKPSDEYIIKSRKGMNKPISRERAYVILQEVADHFEIDCIGTHSMRKTFGYHYYQTTKDIATLQTIFNHSKPEYTLRYIGISQDSIDRAYYSFSYKKKAN
ncbi:integrase [Bacillus ectoiniformans]|uniref:tyrosine-type recombinase/integrase n=1 Tax=Bacillus ectoiniformans TaxID=1494429 RepID=UPI00195F06DC|nr:tyrosine-type recombinase/integrase [Bacillus ectoiniformans]MBM7650528.1 integrase [Bacillus ectoiniformans]